MTTLIPETTPTIIIDCGSATTRAGFAQDAKPRSIFPNVVFSPSNTKTKLIGDAALKKHANGPDILLNVPIMRGYVTDWDLMESIWRYTLFDELQVKNISDHPILLTETILNPKANREKATQIFFETFEIPALIVLPRPELAAAAWGRKEAIVVHCGAETLSSSPLLNSYIPPHAIHRIPFSGKKLTKLLRNSIFEERPTLDIPFWDWNTMKENISVCADSELSNFSTTKTSYTFPNGKTIEFEEKNRFLCSELFFQPWKFGLEFAPLPELIFNSSCNAAEPERFKGVKDVILAGSTTLMPGFPARLERELKLIDPSFRVLSRDDRSYLYWKGGSMVATSPDFLTRQNLWSKEEYDESGPSIVHRRNCW